MKLTLIFNLGNSYIYIYTYSYTSTCGYTTRQQPFTLFFYFHYTDFFLLLLLYKNLSYNNSFNAQLLDCIVDNNYFFSCTQYKNNNSFARKTFLFNSYSNSSMFLT